jgi:hypothetical protein
MKGKREIHENKKRKWYKHIPLYVKGHVDTGDMQAENVWFERDHIKESLKAITVQGTQI